jgi:HEAT repeat protein
MVVGTVLALSMFGQAQSAAQPIASNRAEALVRELRQFPAGLPATGRSDGRPDAVEEQRRSVYEELRVLGAASLPALVAGLADPDVQIRRNVALFLNTAAGSWYTPLLPRLDIRQCLSALIGALQDRDARTRGLAAQAIGEIGSDASAAVPALIALLLDPEEGSRNSACIGLAGIGPGAREALPALRRALSDPSTYVRSFCQRAINTIE